MAHIYRKPKLWKTYANVAGVVGDAPFIFDKKKGRSGAFKNARKIQNFPTPAERELESILNSLNGGVLQGRFFREWPFANRWILDFFFHEIRLGIEVDGSIHNSPAQQNRDMEKERGCDEWSITLIRVTNRDVFGAREHLVAKLREGWRTASDRFKCSPYARLAPKE